MTSRKAMVIDPGGEVEKILAIVEQAQVEVVSLVLTHAHLDHGGGVRGLLRELSKRGFPDVCFAAHAAEAEMRCRISEQALMFGLSTKDFENAPEPSLKVEDGDSLDFGSFTPQILHTPGHSPGHISVFFQKTEMMLEIYDSSLRVVRQTQVNSPALFSGDCLFAGSIGRTDLPGGSHAQLLSSIREKLLTLPDDTRVFAGHGPDTSIGRERDGNPFLLGLV